jgi:hypothetical protein
MEGIGAIVVLVILGIVGVVAWRVAAAPGSKQMAQRTGRLFESSRNDPPARQPTLEDLRPGDAIAFWDGDDEVVESVIEGREELGSRTTTWRWNVLSGGRVIEVAPDERVLYTSEIVLRQGTLPFDTLVAEPSQGGALKTFEARVREGRIAREPVSVELNGRAWVVESTGTFLARYIGPAPKREVWRDISSTPSDNVYFELRADDGTMGLGLWTTHIALLEGRILEDTDIHDFYPGDKPGQQA